MENKKADLSQRQQKKILQSARVCFIKLGLAKTTMRDIAAEAQMSLGNIYRYFRNKKALIEAFLASDMESVGNVFASLETCSDVKSALGEVAFGYIEGLTFQSELLIYVDILSKALREEDKASLIALEGDTLALAEQLQLAEESGRINLSLPAEIAAMTLMAFIENAAVKCIARDSYTSLQAVDDFKLLLAQVIRD